MCGTGLGVLSGDVKKTRLRFEAREQGRAGRVCKHKLQRNTSYNELASITNFISVAPLFFRPSLFQSFFLHQVTIEAHEAIEETLANAEQITCESPLMEVEQQTETQSGAPMPFIKKST